MNNFGRTTLCAAMVGMLLLAAGSANAQTVTQYTDRATFLAALGTTNFYNETFADASFDFGVTINSQAVANGEATGVSGGSFVDRVQPGITAIGGQAARNTTISFLSSTFTNAWGADFDLRPGGEGEGIDVILNFVGGTTRNLGEEVTYDSTGGDGVGFFGVIVSGGTLSNVVLTGGPNRLELLGGSGVENYAFDNMVVAVPEAGTLPLVALGSLSAIGVLVRRRRAAK